MPSETAVKTATQPIESTEKDNPVTNNVINNTTNEESKTPGVSKSEPKSSSNLKRSLEDKLTENDDGKKVRLAEKSTDSKLNKEISLTDNNDGENEIAIAPKSNMCNGAVTEELINDEVSVVCDDISVNCDLQSEHEDIEDTDCNKTLVNNGINSADKLLKKTLQSEDNVDSTNYNKSTIENGVAVEDFSKSPSFKTKSIGSTTNLSRNCETIDNDIAENDETSKNGNDTISICTEDAETKDSDIEMLEEIVHKQNRNNQIKTKLNENTKFPKNMFNNNDDNKICTNSLPNVDETFSEKRLSNDDCEVVSTDSEIDQVNDGDPVEPILQGNRKLSRENFSKFLKLFNQNNFTFEQFESFCTQKIAENITEKNSLGKERSEIHLLMQREKIWRLRYESLVKQVKELKSIINKHKSDLKTDESARPLILNRTVGLQAILCVKEHRLPKRLMSTQFDSNDVDIISDDDDDAVTVSDNLGIKTSSTPVKSSPVKPTTPVNDKSTQAVIKDVPPAVPLNSINNGTIDLTDNDDTPEVTSRSFSEQQSIKIIRRPTVNSVLLPSSPKNMTRTITTQVSPKSLAYIGIPSTSNFLVQSSTATPSQFTTVQHVTTTNSNSANKNIKPFLFKDGKFIPLQIAPVNSRSPAAVTLNTPRLQATPVARLQLGISSNLQAITPLRHPAPLPAIPNQRNLPSWKKLPPSPKLSITKNIDNDSQPKGLVLSWNLILNKSHAEITSYQIYAYQETTEMPKFDLWKKIGEVNALPLPMACSLTQFMEGQKYHFAVRAVDVYTRVGPFSIPQSVHLT